MAFSKILSDYLIPFQAELPVLFSMHSKDIGRLFHRCMAWKAHVYLIICGKSFQCNALYHTISRLVITVILCTLRDLAFGNVQSYVDQMSQLHYMNQISPVYNWPMTIVTSLSTSFCIICTFYKQCFHILLQFICKGIEDQWGEDRFLNIWTKSNLNRKMSLHVWVTFCGLLVSQILIVLIQGLLYFVIALILWVLFFPLSHYTEEPIQTSHRSLFLSTLTILTDRFLARLFLKNQIIRKLVRKHIPCFSYLLRCLLVDFLN